MKKKYTPFLTNNPYCWRNSHSTRTFGGVRGDSGSRRCLLLYRVVWFTSITMAADPEEPPYFLKLSTPQIFAGYHRRIPIRFPCLTLPNFPFLMVAFRANHQPFSWSRSRSKRRIPNSLNCRECQSWSRRWHCWLVGCEARKVRYSPFFGWRDQYSRSRKRSWCGRFYYPAHVSSKCEWQHHGAAFVDSHASSFFCETCYSDRSVLCLRSSRSVSTGVHFEIIYRLLFHFKNRKVKPRVPISASVVAQLMEVRLRLSNFFILNQYWFRQCARVVWSPLIFIVVKFKDSFITPQWFVCSDPFLVQIVNSFF